MHLLARLEKLEMAIYLLVRTDHPWYDEYDGRVICADNEKQARTIANKSAGDEGQMWDDYSLVVCELIDPDGEHGEILASFNAG